MSRLEYPWADLVEDEPWRAEDKKEWDSVESYRARGRDSRIPDTVMRQKLFIHELHLQAPPCWLCGQANTYYFAAGRMKTKLGHTCHCVCCGVELVKMVPFAGPPPWRWVRPNDIKPSTVIHHAELWQEKVLQADLKTYQEQVKERRL